MSEMLLVNPVGRRRRRKGPRRFTALQRSYGFGMRGRRRSRRRVTRMARNPVSTITLPARRRSRRRRVSFGRRRHRRSSYRRNPLSLGGMNMSGFLSDTLLPAAIGAAGALGIDMAWGYLPLPAELSSGTFAPVIRIGAAIGLGYLVGMVAGKRFGQEAMAGAITVTLYDLVKGYMANAGGTSSGTGAYVGYYGSAPSVGGLGVYVGTGLEHQGGGGHHHGHHAGHMHHHHEHAY